MLSKHAIEEFQQIYLQTYGEEISFAEATEKATRLIRLYRAVLGTQILKINPEELKHEQQTP